MSIGSLQMQLTVHISPVQNAHFKAIPKGKVSCCMMIIDMIHSPRIDVPQREGALVALFSGFICLSQDLYLFFILG
jgi:hypothetical protein